VEEQAGEEWGCLVGGQVLALCFSTWP